ncbi:hypothetical protein HCB45_14210 [Listeria sp. FSL L7-0091]|uniref:hypothetical protein n=1 Tax=Listeria farberi TaxID=2713500 RepID=UPI00162595DE|nr:hypothetical protein [Listeria farberi]MBC2262712.1 hypothetical protein [Listeria farberi]
MAGKLILALPNLTPLRMAISVDRKHIESLISKYKTYLQNFDDKEISNRLYFLKALLVINQTKDLTQGTPLVEHIWSSLEKLDT